MQICTLIRLPVAAVPHVGNFRGNRCPLAFRQVAPVQVVADDEGQRVKVEPDSVTTAADLGLRRDGKGLGVARENA